MLAVDEDNNRPPARGGPTRLALAECLNYDCKEEPGKGARHVPHVTRVTSEWRPSGALGVHGMKGGAPDRGAPFDVRCSIRPATLRDAPPYGRRGSGGPVLVHPAVPSGAMRFCTRTSPRFGACCEAATVGVNVRLIFAIAATTLLP